MRKEETQARQLAAMLTAGGLDAQVKGDGVHWRVEVMPVADRSARVHCYWYESGLSGLLLGMNPANSRTRPREPTTVNVNVGPEFQVFVVDRGADVADGRTKHIEEAVGCVKGWLSGASVAQLARVTPFIDQEYRELRAIGGLLDARLDWEVYGSPPAIWVYGESRSCRLDSVSCSFYIGPAPVALASDPADFAHHVTAWILEGATLAQLSHGGVELEPHAEILERGDAARWHWLHVCDRIANPKDVLAPLAPLIQALVASPIASRFYSFSSLHWLCFSASSHYPFVRGGRYPVVSSAPGGKYDLDGVVCDLEEAVTRIESALALSSIQPFFGSEDDYDTRLVAESLGRHGSAIQPQIIRHGRSSSVWLIVGSRRCDVSETLLRCFSPEGSAYVVCGNVDDVIALALSFLTGGASHDDVARDSRVLRPCAKLPLLDE